MNEVDASMTGHPSAVPGFVSCAGSHGTDGGTADAVAPRPRALDGDRQVDPCEPPRGQAPRLPVSTTRLAGTDEDRPPSVSTAVAVSTGVNSACPRPNS